MQMPHNPGLKRPLPVFIDRFLKLPSCCYNTKKTARENDFKRKTNRCLVLLCTGTASAFDNGEHQNYHVDAFPAFFSSPSAIHLYNIPILEALF